MRQTALAFVLLVAAAPLMAPLAAFAQQSATPGATIVASPALTTDSISPADPNQMRSQLQSMSPEQRRAYIQSHRAEIRAKLQAMTPQQRQALRARWQEAKARRLQNNPAATAQPRSTMGQANPAPQNLDDNQ